MSLDFSSVKLKIGLCLLGLFLVNVITVASAFYFLGKSKETGAFINVAGRQRMLSQKMVKEALAYAATGEKKWQESLLETANLFEKSLNGLANGDESMHLGVTLDSIALSDISKLRDSWAEFRMRIDKVINAKSTSDPGFKEAISYLSNNNIGLLKQANELTKRYEELSKASIEHLQQLIVVMLAIGALIFGLCFWIVQSQVVRPIENIVNFVKEFAKGHLDLRITQSFSGEFGILSSAFNHMAENFQKLIKDLKGESKRINSTSEDLKQVGEEVSSQAKQMESVADSVSLAAEIVNENIQLVSQATADLTTATTEIAQSVTQTAQITNSAQDKAVLTNEVIGRLREGSDKIGNIIQVINTIAEQTNLLALNATIEAARAGEAGKGFAVVANEVKELAKQTADATQEITSMIQTIQADTGEAVSSVEEITSIVGQINDLANTIASAAEEQTATVSEISHNVMDAASKVEEVKNLAGDTKGAAEQTVELAFKNLESSKELRELAKQLNDQVSRFRT